MWSNHRFSSWHFMCLPKISYEPFSNLQYKFLSFCLSNFVTLALYWYKIKLFRINLPSNMKKTFFFPLAGLVSCKKYHPKIYHPNSITQKVSPPITPRFVPPIVLGGGGHHAHANYILYILFISSYH